MNFISEILIICFFIFLYCFFVFAKDDFLLLRKNITLEQLFNIIFVSFIVSIFGARFLYVLEHLSPVYLQPLVFLVFPYFPGLSVTGGIISASVIIWYIVRKKKFPLAHLFDIFSLCFLASWFSGMLFFVLAELTRRNFLFFYFSGSVLGFIIFGFLVFSFTKNSLKEGNTAFLSLSFFGYLVILVSMFERGKKAMFHFTLEDLFLGIFSFLLLVLFIHRGKLLRRSKSKNK
jgi:prolipoprotein diacylglyceryltransferase